MLVKNSLQPILLERTLALWQKKWKPKLHYNLVQPFRGLLRDLNIPTSLGDHDIYLGLLGKANFTPRDGLGRAYLTLTHAKKALLAMRILKVTAKEDRSLLPWDEELVLKLCRQVFEMLDGTLNRHICDPVDYSELLLMIEAKIVGG